MAWPKDDNKVYSPYKDKSLKKIQRKQFAPVAKSAELVGKAVKNNLGVRTARAALGGAKKAVSPALNRVASDYRAQRESTQLARRRNNPEKYRVPGDNDAVSARSPQYPTAEEGNNYPVTQRPSQRPVQKANRGVLMTNIGGPPRIEGDVEGLRKRIMAQYKRNQQSGYDTGRTYQAGNLDVSFDGSVPQDRRQAFMENPLRPTAQIDRFKNRRPGRVFSTRLNPENDGGLRPPEFLTAENSNEGWRTRDTLNREMAQNYRAQLNAKYGLQGTKLTDAGSTARAMLVDRGNTERAMLADKRQAERNEMDALNIASQNELRGIQSDKGRLEFDTMTEIDSLVDQIGAAETPAERARLQRILDIKRNQRPDNLQIVTEKSADRMGNPIQSNYVLDRYDQSVTPAVAQRTQAPQKAIDALMQNPSRYREDFLRKYGYLPEGV